MAHAPRLLACTNRPPPSLSWLPSMRGWPHATYVRKRFLAAAPTPGQRTDTSWPHKSSLSQAARLHAARARPE